MIDKRSSPAAARNRGPIADVLAGELPDSGTVLMIAEGSGQHAEHFARRFPALEWLPSDPDTTARRSIAAYRSEAALPNLCEPISLDAAADDWPVAHADALTCINMIHISPWEATLGLFAGAERILQDGALLYLYGPYRRPGRELEPSNASFDASLRARDPRWGIRNLEEVEQAAEAHNLHLASVAEMPANNLSLMFRKRD